MGSWKMKPYCDETLTRLAGEMIDWATNDDDALVLEEFYLMRGISCSVWQKMKKRSQDIEEAHEMAKVLIGMRREKGTIKGKYSDTAVNRTQPAYSPRLREVEEWRSSLKQKETVTARGQIIWVDGGTYPNCPEVPVKPEVTD